MTEVASQPLFRPALILMSGRLVGFVVAFAIPLVLARVFTQEDFGSYKQLFLVFATLFGIAQAGMAESLYYFLPYESRNAGAYVCNTLLVLLGVGGLAAVALWSSQHQVAQLLNNPSLAEYVPLIAGYLFLMLMAVVMEIIMTVRRQHVAASSSYAVTDIARAILSVLPVLWFADLYGLLWGTLAFALLRCAAALVYVAREFGGSLRPQLSALRLQLAYAIPFGIAGLIEILQVNFHLYAVSYTFDAATFAIYAVGCLQIPLVDFLMTSTSNVMMVNMREKLREGDSTAVLSIWCDSVRKLSFIFFPLVGLLLLVADDLIVLLFTASYRGSVPVFMLWTLSMLFFAVLTDGALRVFADTRFMILQNLLRLGLIVALIQGFLQRFDLLGAILVTLLATAVTKLFALWRLRHLLKVPFAQVLPWKDLGGVLLLAALAMLPALLPQLLSMAPVLLRLVLSGALYTLAYGLLLLHAGPLHADEKAMCKAQLRALLFKLLRANEKAVA